MSQPEHQAFTSEQAAHAAQDPARLLGAAIRLAQGSIENLERDLVEIQELEQANQKEAETADRFSREYLSGLKGLVDLCDHRPSIAAVVLARIEGATGLKIEREDLAALHASGRDTPMAAKIAPVLKEIRASLSLRVIEDYRAAFLSFGSDLVRTASRLQNLNEAIDSYGATEPEKVAQIKELGEKTTELLKVMDKVTPENLHDRVATLQKKLPEYTAQLGGLRESMRLPVVPEVHQPVPQVQLQQTAEWDSHVVQAARMIRDLLGARRSTEELLRRGAIAQEENGTPLLRDPVMTSVRSVVKKAAELLVVYTDQEIRSALTLLAADPTALEPRERVKEHARILAEIGKARERERSSRRNSLSRAIGASQPVCEELAAMSLRERQDAVSFSESASVLESSTLPKGMKRMFVERFAELLLAPGRLEQALDRATSNAEIFSRAVGTSAAHAVLEANFRISAKGAELLTGHPDRIAEFGERLDRALVRSRSHGAKALADPTTSPLSYATPKALDEIETQLDLRKEELEIDLQLALESPEFGLSRLTIEVLIGSIQSETPPDRFDGAKTTIASIAQKLGLRQGGLNKIRGQEALNILLSNNPGIIWLPPETSALFCSELGKVWYTAQNSFGTGDSFDLRAHPRDFGSVDALKSLRAKFDRGDGVNGTKSPEIGHSSEYGRIRDELGAQGWRHPEMTIAIMCSFGEGDMALRRGKNLEQLRKHASDGLILHGEDPSLDHFEATLTSLCDSGAIFSYPRNSVTLYRVNSRLADIPEGQRALRRIRTIVKDSKVAELLSRADQEEL